jgi:hypothetical protein
MTAPINGTPLSIDYTSRDYNALRSDLVARMKTRLPEWTGDDPADFGLALIESFAYMGDILNYYIDRVANENYLGTATQRQSIINLAKIYGYNPTGYRAAYVDVDFTNSGVDDLLIPMGTQLTAEVTFNDTVVQVLFTTLTEATVLAGETTTISAIQAEDISTRAENFSIELSGEYLGISNGLNDQQFTLSENQVVDGSVEVWVKEGVDYVMWTNVQHIADFGPADKVYSVTTDSNNYVCINFGDGVSGAIPANNSPIKAVYQVGGGVVGNIPDATPLDITQLFGLDLITENSIRTYVSAVSSSKGNGGLDPEDNDSIRRNAPKALTAFNRAVSREDFANLALLVSGVGKSNAFADLWTSVNVYIAPQQNSDAPDLYPGYGDVPNIEANLTPSFLSIKDDVVSFLASKTQIGASVSVLPPVYSRITLVVQYTKKASYTETRVSQAIRSALASQYSYANLDFGQVITPEAVEATLLFVEGVETAKVQYMYRYGDTPARSVLVGEANEIFSFQDGDISVIRLTSDATLSDLVSSTGALSPVFAADFYNYNITSSTTSITLTPSVTTGATIYLGSSVVATGVAQTISTPSGVTTAIFTVVAADGITTKTYRVTITR